MSVRTTPIGQVVLPVATWNPQTSGSSADFLYIDIGSLDREAKTVTNASRVHPTAAPSRARQIVHRGDILVSTVRPNLNAVALVPDGMDGATASTGFTVLRPSPEKLYGPYLFHWVRTPSFVADMVKQATGASYPAVSDRIVLQSELPLPPLPEQRRIADILDKADAVRRKRKEAIALTEELLRSAFLEMFGDPVTNPKGWNVLTVGDLTDRGASLVDGPFGSNLKPEHYVDEGVRVIRNYNINDDYFDPSQFKYVTAKKFEEIRRSEVRPGDVLITTKGTVGDVCLMPELDGFAVLSATGTVRLRLPEGSPMLGEFMVSQMTQPTYKRYLHTFEAGSAQQYLNLSGIRKMALIMPPQSKQHEFCRVRLAARQLRDRMGHAVEECDMLFSSLVHRAFRGELTHGGSAKKAQLTMFTEVGGK